MKPILSILIAVMASYLLSFYLPWWSITLAPFLLGFLMSFKPWLNLGLGFISIFLLWVIQSFTAYQTHAVDLVPLVGKLLNELPPVALITITGCIGGLYGAIAQVSGHYLKQLFK